MEQGDEGERPRAGDHGYYRQRLVSSRPLDADALARPEDPEGGQHHADRESQLILRHTGEGPPNGHRNRHDSDDGGRGSGGREQRRPVTRPQREHDEDDLEPLEEHALE